jgi:hypothetical protein
MAVPGQRRTMETAGAACGMAAQVAPPAADTDSGAQAAEAESERANAARAAQVHARTLRRIPSALDADDKQVGGAGCERKRAGERERAREKEAPRARALCSAPVQLNTKSWSAV